MAPRRTPQEVQDGAVHRLIGIPFIGMEEPALEMGHRPRRAGDFPQGIARLPGDLLEGVRKHLLRLRRRQPKIQDRERGRVLLVVVFRHAVLLHAEPDVLPVNIEIRLDHPMMPIMTSALKEKRMGPPAPVVRVVQVPLCATD